jgi:hypothetical protein
MWIPASFQASCFLTRLRSISRHNARIWGLENPHILREVVRDSPKVNAWSVLMDRIIGQFFFVEITVTGGVYYGMFEQFMYPQVADLHPNIIYQQDEAPHTGVCKFEKPSRESSQFVVLDAKDQSLGPRIRRISLRWIYFPAGTSRTECMLPVCLTSQRYETTSVKWLSQ